ncbi:MAG: GAF domain-containing protein [Anaerolineales bacterium]|nr:GAF domain-containing protein [Anaerolineales bacterium]
MKAASSSDWRELARLGEQLIGSPSLSAQRDQIASVVARLLKADVDLWLDENLFRLPDATGELVFSSHPDSQALTRILKSRGLLLSNQKGRKNNASRGMWAGMPLRNRATTLGAIQVARPRGPAFKKDELDLLAGLAGIVGVSLVASHRVAVESFRLNQLNLVSQVSSQIANVLDLNELAERVTKLIQQTFHYYYVAIFTLRERSSVMRFRSSAMADREGKRRAKVALEVKVGQGLIGEAAEKGERILVPDVRKDTRYRFINALPETRSEVVIPLKIEGRVLGVLDVQSDSVKAFHPNDLLVLNALADSIARAVEGARLYYDLRRHSDHLTLIADVGKSVSASLEINTLMQNVSDLIHHRFNYAHVNLFTAHPSRRMIEYRAGSGERSPRSVGFTIPLDDPQGIIPWVAREGKTVVANDVRKDKRYIPSPLPPHNTKSEICVPLLYDGEVVGLLDIQSDRYNAFATEDRVMFEAVADHIAIAIHNAALYRSEQWRRQVADSLREVAGLISADEDVDDVLEVILLELEKNLPVEISSIWLLEDDELYLAASHNIDEALLENTLFNTPEAYAAMMRVIETEGAEVRKPTDVLGATGIAAGFNQDYSALAVPLRVGDQPFGVITLAHPSPGRYGNEARTVATTFASYAAVAIENTRLYDIAQEQAYASAALLQVAQAIVSLNDLDEILDTIIRIMPILVGVGRAALYQFNSVTEKFLPSQQYGLSEEEETRFWEHSFAAGEFKFLDVCRSVNGMRACALGAARGLDAWVSADPSYEANFAHPDALLFAVPIAVKDTLYGVMLIEEAEGGLRFRARRLEIINGIAQQAALAIQNDLLQREMVVRERLETEVQLARQIQQTFIPDSLPQVEGWEFAARWRTARQVGGDFYDVFDLPNRKIGLFIADVADKGVPAALFMALTRTLVRAAVLETDSPAEALRRVNELLIPDTKQGMFVTAVYAVLDLEKNELTYVNAGHNPPLWVKGDGAIEKLTRSGIALGAAEEARYEQRMIQLANADSLLFYTDGLTESFNNDGDFYGDARLAEAIVANHCSSASQLMDVVEKSLLDFVQDMPPADDLTMLAVRRV